MTFQPYKFVVHAVVQTVDEAGQVVGEAQAEPVVLFGCAELERWAHEFPDNLAAAETPA